MLRRALTRLPLVPLVGHTQLHSFSVKSNPLRGPSDHQREDQEELDRERKLREKFAQKIYANSGDSAAAASSSSTNASTSANTAGGAGQGGAAGGTEAPPKVGHFTRILFFITTIYMILFLQQIENPNSPLAIFQGIPWWQLPLDTLVYHLLIRSVLSFRQQSAIKAEFEEQQKLYPDLTLPQFFNLKHPQMFQGYRTQQAELVAALSACFAVSRTLDFAQTMAKVAAGAKDTKAAADDIMEAMVRDFPQVFAPPPPPPPPSPFVDPSGNAGGPFTGSTLAWESAT